MEPTSMSRRRFLAGLGASVGLSTLAVTSAARSMSAGATPAASATPGNSPLFEPGLREEL